mgnify:CR=1 FL=1
MQHLLYNWSEIVRRLESAKTLILLVDYDGTMTPIVNRPEDAILSDDARNTLRLLSVLPNLTVGVISGRSLRDTVSKVGLLGVVYAGNHGMEIKELSGITTIDPAVRLSQSIIHSLYRVLVKNLSQIEGVHVEYKGLSLSIHYRLVDEGMLHDVKRIFEDATDIAQKAGDIRITHGKKVFEIRPAVDINKGNAVRILINKYRKGNPIDSMALLPIYIGLVVYAELKERQEKGNLF